MIGRSERDGLLGVCLASSPLCVAARCPFIKANVGAVSTQAYSDPGLGPLALQLLETGYSPVKVLDELSTTDEWSEYRQIGIIDRHVHCDPPVAQFHPIRPTAMPARGISDR